MERHDDGTRERLLEWVGHGLRLPTLPTLGTELLALAHQPPERIAIRQLTELIESDQAMTAAILRLVNSPYYGRARTISQVGRALTLIGLEEALHFLQYQMLKRLMPAFPDQGPLSQNDYFLHSWACAQAARRLGRPDLLVRSLPGELHLAGLMHDIGKVALSVHLPAQFAVTVASARLAMQPLADAETETFGLDHALLGAHVLDDWNLPPAILDAVAFHHEPDAAPPEHRELAALIQLADRIAYVAGIGDGGNPVEPDLTQTWIHRQGSSRLRDADVLVQVAADIRRALLQQAHVLRFIEAEPDAPVLDDARRIAEASAPNPTHAAPKPDSADRPETRRGWMQRLGAWWRR